MALTPGTTSPDEADDPGVVWTTATIGSTAAPLETGPGAGMTAIAVSIADPAPVPGEVLLRPDGDVIGILDASGMTSGGSGSSAFLPAQLVVGVSKDLARWGAVRHGWLDVQAQDAPAPNGEPGSVGAQVESVEPNGASKSVLKVGDVIESVGGEPVTSMAQLRERLYVLSASTPVKLGIVSDGQRTSAEVDLGSSP
jgi:S1-C subfamily serine protease